MLQYRYFSVLLIALFLVSCSSSSLQQKPVPTQQQLPVKSITGQVTPPPNELSPISPLPSYATPTLSTKPGTSAIRGKFIIDASGLPLKGTAFYLVPGVGEDKSEVPPAFAGEQDNTIQGFTNDEGVFILSDIDPGIYYIFVWAPLRWVLVATNDGEDSRQHPLKIQLQQNQIIDFGNILIDWP